MSKPKPIILTRSEFDLIHLPVYHSEVIDEEELRKRIFKLYCSCIIHKLEELEKIIFSLLTDYEFTTNDNRLMPLFIDYLKDKALHRNEENARNKCYKKIDTLMENIAKVLMGEEDGNNNNDNNDN